MVLLLAWFDSGYKVCACLLVPLHALFALGVWTSFLGLVPGSHLFGVCRARGVREHVDFLSDDFSFCFRIRCSAWSDDGHTLIRQWTEAGDFPIFLGEGLACYLHALFALGNWRLFFVALFLALTCSVFVA